MTEPAYRKKRAEFSASFAPIEVKEKAIKALDREFFRDKAILKNIEESKADIDDIGENK